MRTLKRTIVRHIGPYAVELKDDGLSVRLFGHAKKSAKQISIARLASLLGVRKARGRDAAFDEPLGDWIPSVGDNVFASRRIAGGLCRGVVLSYCPSVPEPMFVIMCVRGNKKICTREDLRPAPPPRRKVTAATPLLKD